ncbi:MAG: uroporphyrinogen decarboxylase family protein [Promethearchaeota archaeon]
MNSIERVEAALNFDSPDKVPVWDTTFTEGNNISNVFTLINTPSKNWQPGWREEEKGLFPHPGDDLLILSGIYKWNMPEWAKNNPKYKRNRWLRIPREEIDEWGTIWNRTGKNTSMGHPGRPTLKDWSKLDEHIAKYTPDPFDKSRYEAFIKMSEKFGQDKYRLCMLGLMGPFQTIQNMRGFTNFLMDHKRHPKELKRLLAHFTEVLIKNMDGWIKFGGKPHGFLLIEDLAAQDGPFLSPKMFREFYEPVYGELIKAAHDRGCTWVHHCCGKIDVLIPDLIKWGTDALELDSPRMTGYENLRPFRGKIMFWGCVNIQSIYTQGTPDMCEREVWHMMQNLGTKEGGFGAYFYPQPNHIKVPPENIKAFKRGLEKYGTYSKIPSHWWDYPIPNKWDNDIVPPLPPLKA